MRHNNTVDRAAAVVACAFLGAIVVGAQTTDKNVTQQIQSAKPGSTITLPAGTFKIVETAVPAGVTVRGAGFDKTILDAGGSETGLRIQGEKVTLSDLTVRGAMGAALNISDASTVTLSRVRLLGSGIGLLVRHCRNVRVENVVAAGNRAGFSSVGCEDSAIVNCTVADNSEMGLSLTGNRRCAVFNNLIAGSQTGVMAAPDNQELSLDYNLYVAFFVGTTIGEPARKSLESWRSRFGYDAHSVELKVAFADPKGGDYRPVTPLPWALNRSTASDWGVAALAGFDAPKSDILSNGRHGAPDLGAYEVVLTTDRRPDGAFVVSSGTGVTSAGLFTSDGRNVAWLFHNLPLGKGKYDFWLPPGVPVGEYELRVVEGNLALRYITAIGSIGADNKIENSNSIDPTLVAFDHQDNILMFQGGNEDHTIARSFEPGMQKARWRMTGQGGAPGAAIDPRGDLFFLSADGMFYKLNAATGGGIAIEGASFRKQFKDVFSQKVTGMAELDGKLYVADAGTNRLLVADANALAFKTLVELPSPRGIAADRKNKLLWVISGDKLFALDATGARKHEATPVAKPVALAANSGRLAVYSGETRRVHVFDCADPANLTPGVVIGREWKPGDTGLGQIQLDRLSGEGGVAIDSTGNVVVLDQGAPKIFKADGAFVRAPMPIWGQFVACGPWTGPDGKVEFHVSGLNQTYTMVVDLEKGTWRPGIRFELPKGVSGTCAAYFTEGGKNFAAYTEDAAPNRRFIVCVESSGATKSMPVAAPGGKPATSLTFLSDGRLMSDGCVIPRSVDTAGNLVYDWSKCAPKKMGAMPVPGQGGFNGDFLADGSWVEAGGKSRGFGGGFTVLQAVDAAGATRWEHAIDYHCTVGAFRSLRVLPGVALACAPEELDTMFVSHDGLGLGIVGPSPEFRWTGYWHDQDWSLRTFVGHGNRRYLLLGDYVRHTAHLMEITGVDEVKRDAVKVSVDAAKAQAAAASKVESVHNPTPSNPKVVFKKLAAPLKIDGDLKKWREKNIAPQIVVVSPGILPTDCSALIRCAWEGDNLYFQVIKFDDVVTFHQPLSKHYMQDSTELALVGGYMGGYKFAITRVTDAGEIIFREQFLCKKDLLLDPVKAPRVIKVLENAKDIEERKLIEALTGVDLSGAKVIITEFMIPMSYAWDGKAPIEMKSGTGFWFGWFIDDNDTPGLDEQKAHQWPVTFAVFGNPDQGAWGILE